MEGTMGKVFARVTFVPSLVYNLAMARLSARRWFDRVDDRVILGALPFRNMTHQLVEEEGVRGVVSMNEDYELKWLSNMTQQWSSVGVKFLQLSTTDIFEAPCQAKLRQGVEFIRAFDRAGDDGLVYVHCKAGRTRSATLVACYLMQKNNWTPEQALSHIAACRPHMWLGPKQHQAIQAFHQDITTPAQA